ncbi:MAG: LytTR family DNA-binding domain-containing protein [Spirochaetaceae bacterium]|nr:LytTR family DNA-binding domain-containing protein [Spirochaetaceae bacterium]
MRSVYKEMLSRPAILVAIVMVAVAVAAFAVLGPMGTYDALTAGQRLAFGALYAVIGWPLGYAAVVVAAYFLRRQSALTMALALTAVALFVSLPCTAVVHTVETLAHPHYSASAGLTRLYIQVATVAVVYDLLFLYLVYVRTRHGHALASARVSDTNSAITAAPHAGELVDQAGAGAETSPEFASTTTGGASKTSDAGGAAIGARREPDGAPAQESQKPGRTSRESDGTQDDRDERVAASPLAEFGSEVIFLKSEDHYIHVRTSTDSALIKMRFAEAIAELGGAGIQVHRSYWVAFHHMRGLTKRDRKLMLRLSGDHLVPISARHRVAVQTVLQSQEQNVSSSD